MGGHSSLQVTIQVVRFTVQGSPPSGIFDRVKDKDGIEAPKSSSKMLISPNNYLFGSKFCIIVLRKCFWTAVSVFRDLEVAPT